MHAYGLATVSRPTTAPGDYNFMKHRIDDIIKKSSKSSDFGLRIFGLRTSDFRTSDFGRPRLLVLEVLYPSVVLYTVPTAVLVASKCTYYCTGTVVLVGTVHVQY